MFLMIVDIIKPMRFIYHTGERRLERLIGGERWRHGINKSLQQVTVDTARTRQEWS